MQRVVAAWKRAAPIVIPAVVLLAFVLAIFWRVWTPLEGERRAFAWDAQWEYWGDLQFQVDAIGDGEAPLWNPWDRTGYPFHADPQAGTLYPLSWLLWLLAGLIGHTPQWLISVKIFAHFGLAALGSYWLAARLGLPRPARYLGAIIVVTSYPFLHQAFSALGWSYAWTAWIMLAADRWAERPTPGRAAWLALATGCAALAGGWAGFWYGLLAAIPWTIWALAHHHRKARSAGTVTTYWRGVAGSGAIALGLFAALVVGQLVATAALVPETVRSHRDVAFFGTSVLDSHDLVGMFVPRMAGENTYLGLAPILWAVLVVARRPSARNLVLVGIFVLGWLCAFGNRAPFLPVLASVIFPFGLFRRAHRYLYVCVVPFALLAGVGLNYLVTAPDAERPGLRRAAVIAMGVGAAVLMLCFALKLNDKAAEAMRSAFGFGLISALIAGWLTWMLLATSPRTRAAFAVIAVVAVAGDLWMARVGKVEAGMQALPRPRLDAELRSLAGVPLEARIYDKAMVGYRPGLRLQLRDFGGYDDDPLALSRYAALRDKAWHQGARHLGHAGVRWFYERKDLAIKKTAADTKVMRAQRPEVWELLEVAPAVAWYDVATVVAPGAALDTLLKEPAGTIAVLEAPTLDAGERARAAQVDVAATPRVVGRLDRLDRNYLRATVTAPGDGVVVINEAWFPRGWSARVDGAPAHLVPANVGFRGVLVGPGDHVIEMSYDAPSWIALAALVPLALLVAAGLILRDRRRDRRAPAGATGGDGDGGGGGGSEPELAPAPAASPVAAAAAGVP